MSFSKDTKAELASAELSRKGEEPLLYGMLLFSRKFTPKEISVKTESRAVASVYSQTLSSVTSAIVEVTTNLSRKNEDESLYTLRVPDAKDCLAIFDRFGHMQSDLNLRINRANIEDEESLAYFLRGVFLVCGSVSSPEKDYHLEFVVPFTKLAEDLARIIGEVEVLSVKPSIVRRKGNCVVYIKGSDSIADVLAYIGAPMASLDVVQQKIYRSVRNKVNRKINSETANSNKTAAASARQLRAIELIEKRRGLSCLSDDLRELAQLRLENPEYNLRELGEALSSPISRSGVNHRLQRIMEIADEIGNDE